MYRPKCLASPKRPAGAPASRAPVSGQGKALPRGARCRSTLRTAVLAFSLAGTALATATVSAYPYSPGAPLTRPERTDPAPRSLVPDGAPRGGAGLQRPPGRDRTFLNDTVVRLEARAVSGAESNEALGQRRSGTGVLLDKSTVLTIGYLLVEVDEVDVVTPAGKRIPASVAGYDPDSGFGLVRTAVPLDGRPLELGDSDRIGERQQVLTLGHGEPEATELMVISRKPFAGSWEYLIDKGIFTFPPVNNWSGAALVDEQGKLVGIGSLIVGDAATSQPSVPGNLYVPVNLLKPILADLLATGRRGGPAQPWLGVVTEVVQGHLLISKVSRGGPAERAGLAAGDIIVSVNGQYVATQSELYQGIRKLGTAGATIPLRILKRGDLLDLPIKSSDRMDTLRKPQGI